MTSQTEALELLIDKYTEYMKDKQLTLYIDSDGSYKTATYVDIIIPGYDHSDELTELLSNGIKESNIDINSLYSLLSKEIADKVYSLIQKKQSFKVADFMIIFK